MNSLKLKIGSPKLKRSKLMLLLYAIGTVIIVPLVGQMTLSEVIVAFSLPFLSYLKLIKKYSLLKAVLIGFFVLFLAQILSDTINHSTAKDFSRGLALILFSVFSTFFLLTQFTKQSSNILFFVFLIFIIQLFFGYDGGGIETVEVGDNYFKFRFIPALNMLTIFTSCLFWARNKKRSAIITFFINAIICIIFASRSNGLIYLVAGILLYLKVNSIKLNARKILFYSILLLIILYVLYVVYANQVVYHGFGGINSKKQFSMMTNIYNPFELLIYGRTDFFVTLQAIYDNPIWGYGSWAKDPGGKYTTLLNFLSGGLLNVDTGYIPIHSVFIGTWATAGILGFLATLYVYIILFRRFFEIYKFTGYVKHLPMVIALTVDMLWAYLFSPLSLLRSAFPIFVAIIVIEHSRIELLKKKQTLIDFNYKQQE